MKKNVSKIKLSPKIIGLLIVIALSVFSFFSLLKPGYFFMHDDVQVMRLFEMEKCFQDGQIPCRWVSNMGANYGHPLFNYHPVFSYYLGTFFRLFGLSFISISKILFLLTYLLSGIFMYLLIQSILGTFAGITAATFFVFAPYHAVDVYVRGAMTESWGIVFFPLIFYALYQLARYPKKTLFLVLTALSLAGLFLSHNIMTLLFTPIAFAWGLYWFAINKNFKQITYLILGFAWGVGLAAFFLLPAFLEKSLVKIDTLTSDYYNFRFHYANIRQLFLDRSWGYGPSRPGPVDDLSFQLGWPHWWLAVAGMLSTIFFAIKKRSRIFYLTLFASTLYLGAIFMTHSKSVFVWNQIPIISFVQFPWRFLGIAMFAGSILTGALFALVKKRHRPLLALVLSLSIIGLNFQYFRISQHNPSMTDELKLSGDEYRTQAMATLLDYMPTQVENIPDELAPENPWVIQGEAQVSQFRKRSNFWRFTVENNTNASAEIQVPVFNFPNWIVLIDQQPVVFSDDNDRGLIQVTVPPGKYTVVGLFQDTPLRTTSNAITIFSFTTLVLYVVIKGRHKTS